MTPGRVEEPDNVQAPPDSPFVGLAGALLAHPSLWVTGLVQALRLSAPRWWRRWPLVPAPTTALWRFRMECAYGGDGSVRARPDDVVEYLRWCRELSADRRV